LSRLERKGMSTVTVKWVSRRQFKRKEDGDALLPRGENR